MAVRYGTWSRSLASAAAIFLLMDMNRLFAAPLPRLALHLAVWATFSAFLFAPRDWWTRARAAVAAGIVGIECAVGIALFQEIKLLYLAAVFLFAAALRRWFSRSLAPIVAAMIAAAALYANFGRASLFDLFSYVLLAFVLYFFIRSRIQRNEMNELNRKQLIELQDAYAQLQEASATAMQNAVLEERTRIAREMHDSVGHSLTSLIVQMQALRYMLKENPAQAGASLEQMLAVARQGLNDIRSSVHALADDRTVPGLSALRSLLDRAEATANIRCRLQADAAEDEIGAESYADLFRVLQESLTNVIRHSRATELEVELRRTAGTVVMRIRDNGELTPGGGIDEGFGLRAMRARLEERGGSLAYRAAEPNGFEVTAVVPEGGRTDSQRTGEERR